MAKDDFISLAEFEMLEFFGHAHDSREYGSEWFDSDSVYSHSQPNGLVITCAIHPIHKDARITLTLDGVQHYDWQATALADIALKRGADALLFHSQSGDVVTLRLRPSITINHNCKFRLE